MNGILKTGKNVLLLIVVCSGTLASGFRDVDHHDDSTGVASVAHSDHSINDKVRNDLEDRSKRDATSASRHDASPVNNQHSEQWAPNSSSAVWYSILPIQPTVISLCGIGSSNPFALLFHSWRRPDGAETYQLEFRNAAGDLLLTRSPYTPRFPRQEREGRLLYEDHWYATDRIVRRIGDLPDGEYLIALTSNGTRVSNVASVILDWKFNTSAAPRLQIRALEPLPGWPLPAIGIQAVGPDPIESEFTNAAIHSATVYVDGVPHKRSISWVGPIGPLGPGEAYATLVDLGTVQELAPGKHEVFVRVLDHESNHLTLPHPFEGALTWDEGSLRLKVRPPLPAQVFGKVTTPDGDSPGRYDVKLGRGGRPQYTESVGDDGRYEFVSVPSGEYVLECGNRNQRYQQVGVKVERDDFVEVPVDMRPRYQFSGNVMDSAGKPMADANVSAEWEERGRRFSASTQTDSQGQYTLGAPIMTVVQVHAEHPGYRYEAYAHDRDEPSYSGDLSGRDDIGLVLLTNKEFETRREELREAYQARQQASYLVGGYAHVDTGRNALLDEPTLAVTRKAEAFSLTYAPVGRLEMMPGKGGLVGASGQGSFRFYFDAEKQRYYLVHTAPKFENIVEFIKTFEPPIVPPRG